METQNAGVESVTLSDILNLATWDRERTSEELQSFVNVHHANLSHVELGIE